MNGGCEMGNTFIFCPFFSVVALSWSFLPVLVQHSGKPDVSCLHCLVLWVPRRETRQIREKHSYLFLIFEGLSAVVGMAC